MATRTVRRIVTAQRQLEGGGFVVRRPFPGMGLDMVDPFLLLDEMGPVEYAPGEAVGAPDHPHRGFETVTYVLSGEMFHEDSAGHGGHIGPGDVQWMTAGAGVVHSEMPSQAMQQRGGRMHGFQIWVNLPAADKMVPPRYQGIPAAEIPKATTEDGLARVTVVAGEALGTSAVIETHTPITYQHWTLQPGADVTTPVPEGHNALVYVFDGRAVTGPAEAAQGLDEGQMAVLNDGDSVRLAVAPDAEAPAQLLLLAGKPLNETVARYGPFVMNSRQQLIEAFEDYQAGRLGRIAR